MCLVQLQVGLVYTRHLAVQCVVYSCSCPFSQGIIALDSNKVYHLCFLQWRPCFTFEILTLSSFPPYSVFAFSETKVCSPESTSTAFSTVTLPTTTFVNGVSPNPPSSEDALSPKSSPPQTEPLGPTENPESQPPPLTIAPTHQLLSIHRTLFEEEEDEENRRSRLAERPGELIAAGECWRRRRLEFPSPVTALTWTPRLSPPTNGHLYSLNGLTRCWDGWISDGQAETGQWSLKKSKAEHSERIKVQ